MATWGMPARQRDDGELITYADERGVKVVVGPELYLGLCLPDPRISARVAIRPFFPCARNYATRGYFSGTKIY